MLTDDECGLPQVSMASAALIILMVHQCQEGDNALQSPLTKGCCSMSFRVCLFCLCPPHPLAAPSSSSLFFLSTNINPSLMCAHACESLISPLPQLIWPWHRLHFIEETAARQREAPINWRTGKPITYLKMGLPISGKALRGVVFHVAYTRPRIRQYVGLLTMTNPLFVLPAQPKSFLFWGEEYQQRHESRRDMPRASFIFKQIIQPKLIFHLFTTELLFGCKLQWHFPIHVSIQVFHRGQGLHPTGAYGTHRLQIAWVVSSKFLEDMAVQFHLPARTAHIWLEVASSRQLQRDGGLLS